MTMTPNEIKEWNNFIVNKWADIKKLGKHELLHLLASYDEYVRQIIEENEGEPVCLAEFYEYDYPDYFINFKSDLLD